MTTTTAARTPYDADHAAIVDEGRTITVLYIPDPEQARNPREVLANITDHAKYEGVEIIATAERFYRSEGATFSGWIIRTGPNFSDSYRNKPAVMNALRDVIRDYFPAAPATPADDESTSAIADTPDEPPAAPAGEVLHTASKWVVQVTANDGRTWDRANTPRLGSETAAQDLAERLEAAAGGARRYRVVQVTRTVTALPPRTHRPTDAEAADDDGPRIPGPVPVAALQDHDRAYIRGAARTVCKTEPGAAGKVNVYTYAPAGADLNTHVWPLPADAMVTVTRREPATVLPVAH